jgi:hypothetical protein
MNISSRNVTKVDFFKQLRQCMKIKRFIPIIINIQSFPHNHANIILIDTKLNQIELFEPHGDYINNSSRDYIYRFKFKILRNYFKDKLKGYKFINAVKYIKGRSFQIKNDPNRHSGFCIMWVILYVHYRVLNPDVPLSVLIKYLDKKVKTNFLLRYAKYVEEQIKKN